MLGCFANIIKNRGQCAGASEFAYFYLPAGPGGCAIEFYFDFISSWTVDAYRKKHLDRVTGGEIFKGHRK